MAIISSLNPGCFPPWKGNLLLGIGTFFALIEVAEPQQMVLSLYRYRLAGLPGEYQYKNITSAEINYCLVKDLIIWTQYEIQVASYNGAGLGTFSRAVAEYTLQGGELCPLS